jgi:hypothetical protein
MLGREPDMMTTQSLTELVASLSPEEQAAVADFIRFLHGEKDQPSPFLSAIDEFMTQHPELLRRLAE